MVTNAVSVVFFRILEKHFMLYMKVVHGSTSAKVSTFCALQIYDSVPTTGYNNAIYMTDQYLITKHNSFRHTETRCF